MERTGTPLHVAVPDRPIEVVCDPERVAQIVRILIDNAISHTPDSTPIEVEAIQASGDYLQMNSCPPTLNVPRSSFLIPSSKAFCPLV